MAVLICDPCCQNETLLCTLLKLSSWSVLSKVKVLGLYLGQFPIRPEIIKITSFRLQIWSKTLSVHLKHINNYDLLKSQNFKKKSPHGYFQLYLHSGSCTEASHFNRMGHIMTSDDLNMTRSISSKHLAENGNSPQVSCKSNNIY